MQGKPLTLNPKPYTLVQGDALKERLRNQELEGLVVELEVPSGGAGGGAAGGAHEGRKLQWAIACRGWC
jgi:hypothetical protein